MVTPSEEVEKGTNVLEYLKEPVVTIRKNDLDNFQGESTASTGWFNLDHEWLKKKFSTLEPDFIKKIENNIEGQDIETYETFVLPLDNTKLNISMCIDSATPNKKKKQGGKIWITKKQPRIQNYEVIKK